MTSKKTLAAEDVFQAQDFESIRLTIKAGNTTTQIEFPDTPAIRLIELRDNGAVLEVPARSCSSGHNLMLQFQAVTPSGTRYDFSSTAKVDGHEKVEDVAYAQISVVFIQYDEKLWLRFCESFSARQEEIEQFLKGARGY